MIKRIICILCAAVILAGSASAAPYRGYTYDRFGHSEASAVGYEPLRSFVRDVENDIELSEPQGMYIDDEDGTFYIADTGNNRIVVMDKDFKFIKTLDEFSGEDGVIETLLSPKDVFKKDDTLYIADYDNNRVLVCNTEGELIRMVTKPDAEVFPVNNEFKTLRVLVDSADNLYVLVSGLFQGAVTFDKSGNFSEFYGAARVAGTAELMQNLFWKTFLPRSLWEGLARYVPTEFTGFDIDKDDFIYCCTEQDQQLSAQMRKLNMAGANVWNATYNYGDMEFSYVRGRQEVSSFVDIAVDKEGFVYGLDSVRKRVFTYDNEGTRSFMFGGSGYNLGAFSAPVAIDTYERGVFVLDSEKGTITEFCQTQYGKLVYDATLLFNDGQYENSKLIWEQVVACNANNYLGYYGIGKALFHTGEYEEAMEYFRMGNARGSESKSFVEYRSHVIRDNFGLAITLLIVLIIAVVFFRKRKNIAAFFRNRGVNKV